MASPKSLQTASEGSKSHEILILGGNYGGVNVAHYLLRHTLPALKKIDVSRDYHVTMISPSTHFYWKIGAPRALINKDLIPLDTIFKPIREGFSSYIQSGEFNYVQGTAIAISASSRTVAIKKPNDSHEQNLKYDSLIIATGTTSNSPLWTLHGKHGLSLDAHNQMHAILPSAKTIVVGGGGAVGIETAGEIAAAFPDVKVTLLSGSSRLLERAPVSGTGKRAEDRLRELSVDLVHNLRVKSQENVPDKQVKLLMGDGSNRVVDIYIDATGGRPNTNFVPSSWLNEQKRIKVYPNTFRAKGADSAGTYAIGDAADYSNQTYMWVDAAVAPLCSALGVDISKTLYKDAKDNASSGLLGWLFGSGSVLTQKDFKPLKGTIIVPIGRKGGAGSVLGFQIPSIMVHLIKGRTYFTEQVPQTMTGELRAKP